MKIKLENIDFNHINIKSRVDRLEHIESELDKLKITSKKFDAITNPEDYDLEFVTDRNPHQSSQWTKGQRGCYLSHRKLLENHNDSNKILGILEDDVVFCEDFKDRMKYIEDNFNYDWDIFFMSSFYHLNSDNNRWNVNGDYEFTDIKYIHRTYGSFTTHSYLVNPKSIKKILEKMDEFFKDSYAIDHLYILIQPYLNVFSFTPGMTNQMTSYSDVTYGTKDQTMFKNICGEHYYSNKLSDFNYDEYFKNNK
jgi:GR25 family glycosyltransferase involved in LPS biosynthesis